MGVGSRTRRQNTLPQEHAVSHNDIGTPRARDFALAEELQQALRGALRFGLVRPVRLLAQAAYPDLTWHCGRQIVQAVGRTWLYRARSLSFAQRLFPQLRKAVRGHRLGKLVPQPHSSC